MFKYLGLLLQFQEDKSNSSPLCIRLGFPCLPQLVISMHMWPCHQIRHGYTYLVVFIGKNAWSHMMQFEILSLALLRMLGVTFCVSKHMFSQCHFSCHHGDEWILCFQYMVLTFWQMQLLIIQLMQILFHRPFLPKEWQQRLRLKQRLCHITAHTLKMISSFYQQRYFDVYTSRWMTSFINVPTWHGQRKALNVLLF